MSSLQNGYTYAFSLSLYQMLSTEEKTKVFCKVAGEAWDKKKGGTSCTLQMILRAHTVLGCLET